MLPLYCYLVSCRFFFLLTFTVIYCTLIEINKRLTIFKYWNHHFPKLIWSYQIELNDPFIAGDRQRLVKGNYSSTLIINLLIGGNPISTTKVGNSFNDDNLSLANHLRLRTGRDLTLCDLIRPTGVVPNYFNGSLKTLINPIIWQFDLTILSNLYLPVIVSSHEQYLKTQWIVWYWSKKPIY